ncbi:hypothetical protein K661_02951 [Piscirickettsia salmonis LF-89 = ATCC VR-1361]|nr:hypothetical protein K661_02951 [Piscirickettsia salmonis LF-89 = ATCC VR-1361]
MCILSIENNLNKTNRIGDIPDDGTLACDIPRNLSANFL